MIMPDHQWHLDPRTHGQGTQSERSDDHATSVSLDIMMIMIIITSLTMP
jgi:hypothetical protein